MKRQAEHGWRADLFWPTAAIAALIPLVHSVSLLGPFSLPKAVFLWLGAATLVVLAGFNATMLRQIIVPKSWIGALPAVFWLLLAATTLNGLDPRLGLFGARGHFVGLVTYGAAIILFYAAWSTVTVERMAVFGRLSVWPAIPLSILALAQRAGLSYPIDFSTSLAARAGATVGNPNFLGIYLAMTLAISLGLTATDDSRYRPAWYATTALTLAGLAATNSLGAWAAAAVVVLVFAATTISGQDSSRARLIGFSSLVAGSIGFGAWLWLTTDVAASILDRAAVWTGGLRALERAPLFGTGLETMRFIMPGVQPLSLRDHVYADAHNVFITLGASAGLLSMAVFAAIVVLWLRPSGGSTSDNLLINSYKLGVAAYIIGHLFNPESAAPMALFWVMGGVLTRVSNRSRSLTIGSRAPGAALVVAGLVLTGWLGINSAHLWQAERLIKLADRERNIHVALDYAAQAQNSWPHYALYGYYLFDRTAPFIKNDPIVAKAVSASLKRAIRRAPRDADAYYFRASFYSLLSKNGDRDHLLDLAIADYKQSLKYNRVKLLANYEIAKLYLNRGENAEAAKHLKLILKLIDGTDSHRPEILGLLRRAEMRPGRK